MQATALKVLNVGFVLLGAFLTYLEAISECPVVLSQHRPHSAPSQLSAILAGSAGQDGPPLNPENPSSARSLVNGDQHTQALGPSLQGKGLLLFFLGVECKFLALLAVDGVASSLFQWVAGFGQHNGLTKTLLPGTDVSRSYFQSFFRQLHLADNIRSLCSPPPSTTLVLHTPFLLLHCLFMSSSSSFLIWVTPFPHLLGHCLYLCLSIGAQPFEAFSACSPQMLTVEKGLIPVSQGEAQD